MQTWNDVRELRAALRGRASDLRSMLEQIEEALDELPSTPEDMDDFTVAELRDAIEEAETALVDTEVVE